MNSKKFTPELALELENLINNTIDKSFLPYVKGKSIRIGHVIVRETRVGFFLVFDTKENAEIAKMFCKTGAVALAKSIVSKQDNAEIKLIKTLDDIISKNFNDAIFYKHTIRVTKDDIKKQVGQMRYSVARDATQDAKDKLDTFIYY